MSTGWRLTAGEWCLIITLSIFGWVTVEWLDGHEVRLDRHYHARVALEGQVGVLQDEVGVLRDLVRQQDKQIDCYYETANRVYQRMALSECLELK